MAFEKIMQPNCLTDCTYQCMNRSVGKDTDHFGCSPAKCQHSNATVHTYWSAPWDREIGREIRSRAMLHKD